MFRSISVFTFGLVLLIGAVISAIHTASFVRSSVVVPGHVIALNAGGSHPQVAFTTRRGEPISYPQGGFISGMKVGGAVMVRYSEEDPLPTATLDEIGAIWFAPILLGIMATGFLVTGLWNLIMRKKQKEI
jgi:hypothetical protein